MAQIIRTKDVNPLNLAYGKNIVSLFDQEVPSTIDKYLLNIVEQEGFQLNTLSTMIQIPNKVGYAHFDLQNYLKNQVTHNPNIESTTILTTSESETHKATVQHGWQIGSSFFVSNTLTDTVVLNGRKRFDEIDWDFSEYSATVKSVEIGGITYLSVTSKMKALTDRHIKSKLGSQISDGKPTTLGDNETCNFIDLFKDDNYTLSFLQYWTEGFTAPPNFFDGITHFDVYFFNGTTQLGTVKIDNTTDNGGGPLVEAKDYVITIQSSQLNSFLTAFPTSTHMYLIAKAYNSLQQDPASEELSQWYRFDFKENECDDDNHIQVSWVNSFGFRDYYTFNKRNDYKITTSQKTYTQINGSWSSPTFEVDPSLRGERVFNKSQVEEYTASTGFITDEEDTYLKNLYLSPDVKVRFAGESQWVPVILTNNTYTNRRFKYDRLFQHTINFKLSNINQIQRG